MMQGFQVVEVDVDEGSILVKEENADCVEILEGYNQCTTCGEIHSKNFSCDGNNIFTSEVFLCSNQECGKTFESEIELEQHADSCQVTIDLPLTELATAQDEDYYLLRPNLKKCKECQKKFNTKLLYLQHMRTFHPELIKCSLLGCNKFFRKQTDFEKHKKKKHKNAVSCAFCGKDYSSKLSVQLHLLSQHLQQREKEPKFEGIGATGKSKCPHCCNFYIYLKLHVKTYHPETIVKCVAPRCCRDFMSQEEMQEHFQKLHNSQRSDIFHKNFSTNKNLEIHKEQHTQKNISTTDCIHCGLRVKNFPSHVRNYHPDKVMRCNQAGCRKCFVSERSLRDHWQLFHSPVNCIHCDKVFEKRPLYYNHVYSSHKNEISFKCSFRGCIHFFRSYLEMENHYTKNHPLQAKCDLCGHLAPSQKNMLSHMKRMHYPSSEETPLAQNSPGVGTFSPKYTDICNFCSKEISLHQLDGHKNASCRICGKTIPCEGLLTQHTPTCGVRCPVCKKQYKDILVLKIHQTDQEHKYKCEKCPKSFYVLDVLLQHVLEAHGKMVECKNCGKTMKKVIFEQTHRKLCVPVITLD